MLNDEPLIRWHTTISYRTANSTRDVHHDLGEIIDMHDLIERADHWDTIEKIEIVRVNQVYPNLTVEQSLTI